MSGSSAHFAAPALSLRRIFAATGVALVLALAIFTASPTLHHWVHGDAGPGGNDGCAVVLFAAGVTLAVVAVMAAGVNREWRCADARPIETIFVASPRYLRQPERGPPHR